ncbi:hypothetical protein ACQPWY_30545 [Pseudonocardia xinjiangensis]|uniref:hypothetical protein n=1 Tax=Pseudonocardia xinjiangensis TaxID=75289 RepID=UPI003D8D080C
MPRSNRPRRPTPGRTEHVPLRSASLTRVESAADGEWMVRSVPGSSSAKTYRCPGCDHLIPAGAPHVVAWPAAEFGSVEERRHWHAPCWQARDRRGPGRRRWR